MSDLLARNLQALAQAGVPLDVHRVRAADEAEGTLVLPHPHAVADPIGEAAGYLPPEATKAALVVLVGAGAGHAVDVLLDGGYAGRMLVLEPSAVSCRAALSRRDWTGTIRSGRLRWLLGPRYEGWLDAWSWVKVGEAPAIGIHPALGRAQPDLVRQALQVLKQIVFNAAANERARRQFGPRYLRQTLANLPRLRTSRDVGTLFGRFAGTPVVVLAAGPTLDRNLEQLRAVRDRALVIAVDTALRPCLAAGLSPDLVVGVDPGEANLRHLAVGEVPEGTYLVAEASLVPESFRAFAGRTFTFRVGDHHPWPWLVAQGITRETLKAWGSVLASALDLAVRVGGHPIVLLGADFAFTGGQPYARNTAYEADWTRGQAEGYPLDVIWREWIKGAIEATDITGRVVPTTPHLMAFRDWIANYARGVTDRRIVNGTGAGLLDSLPHVQVHEVLASSPPLDVAARLARLDVPTGTGSLEGLPWWDGGDPPEPWATWVAETGCTFEDLTTAAGRFLPAHVRGWVERASARQAQESGTDERPFARAYWAVITAGGPAERVEAARTLVRAPVSRLSEVFYSAVCVLLRDGGAAHAREALEQALLADVDGTAERLLPVLAYACLRTRDPQRAQILFGVCERRGWLSGRNAWAADVARQALTASAFAAFERARPGHDEDTLLGRVLLDEVLPSPSAPGAVGRLPDFLVVGSAHCGATPVFEWIASSSSVWAPTPRDIGFFSRLVGYGPAFYARFFAACPPERRCGEVSSAYLDQSHPGYPPAHRRDVARAIARLCPQTRLVLVLGDPVARLLSLYAASGGRVDDATFEQLAQWRHGTALVAGAYVEALRVYRDLVGAERLLVVGPEQLADPATLAPRVAAFLDIAPPAGPLAVTLAVPPGTPAALRDALEEYYRASREALWREFRVRV